MCSLLENLRVAVKVVIESDSDEVCFWPAILTHCVSNLIVVEHWSSCDSSTCTGVCWWETPVPRDRKLTRAVTGLAVGALVW